MSDTPPGRLALAGYIRDLPFELDGRIARGARHFAPGARVFLTSPYGAGLHTFRLQRSTVTVIGPHRDTGKIVAHLCLSSRIRSHYRLHVTHRAVLDYFDFCRSMGRARLTPETWKINAFPAKRTPANQQGVSEGWDEGAWETLTTTLLNPSRARLAACLACALDCDEETAQAYLDAGDAGGVLHAQVHQRPGGRKAVRRVAEVWETLAPPRWIGASERTFRSRGAPPAGRASPSSLMAAVCLCADVAGVTSAEALAREIAAACGLRGDVRVVWEVLGRAEIATSGLSPWSRRLDPRVAATPTNTPAGAWMQRLAGAIWYNFTGWMVRARGVVPPAAVAPLVELHRLGYALGEVSDARVTLRCPALPIARPRKVDGTKR